MPPGGSIQRDVSRRRSDRLTVKPDDGVFGVFNGVSRLEKEAGHGYVAHRQLEFAKADCRGLTFL